MRLEEILSIDNNQIVTESGIKTAIGNAYHEVGDMVWVDGNCVFGTQKNSQPVMASSKDFVGQAAGYLVLGCDANDCYVIFNADSFKQTLLVDNTPTWASAISVKAFCYNSDFSRIAWICDDYVDRVLDKFITVREWTAENGFTVTEIKSEVTNAESTVAAWYSADNVLHWRVGSVNGSVTGGAYEASDATIDQGLCEVGGIDVSYSGSITFNDYEGIKKVGTQTASGISGAYSSEISEIESASDPSRLNLQIKSTRTITKGTIYASQACGELKADVSKPFGAAYYRGHYDVTDSSGKHQKGQLTSGTDDDNLKMARHGKTIACAAGILSTRGKCYYTDAYRPSVSKDGWALICDNPMISEVSIRRTEDIIGGSLASKWKNANGDTIGFGAVFTHFSYDSFRFFQNNFQKVSFFNFTTDNSPSYTKQVSSTQLNTYYADYDDIEVLTKITQISDTLSTLNKYTYTTYGITLPDPATYKLNAETISINYDYGYVVKYTTTASTEVISVSPSTWGKLYDSNGEVVAVSVGSIYYEAHCYTKDSGGRPIKLSGGADYDDEITKWLNESEYVDLSSTESGFELGFGSLKNTSALLIKAGASFLYERLYYIFENNA